MHFKPTIFVEADARSFTFRYKDRKVVLATFLHVSTDKKLIILAVGTPPPTGVKSRCVELFGSPLQTENYSDFLAAFLRHGVAMVSSGWARVVRPRMHIRVARKLVEWTGGYHDGTFRSAALQAGPPADQDVTVEANW